MITKSILNEMKNSDIKSCNKADLIDIRTIEIDKNKSQMERLLSFIQAVKNPYLFKLGDIAVKVSFADNEQSMQKKMENIISAKMAL